jgi:hypothetical protein
MEKIGFWIGVGCSILTTGLLFFKIEDQVVISAKDFMMMAFLLTLMFLWILSFRLIIKGFRERERDLKNEIAINEGRCNRLKVELGKTAIVSRILLDRIALYRKMDGVEEMRKSIELKKTLLETLDQTIAWSKENNGI